MKCSRVAMESQLQSAAMSETALRPGEPEAPADVALTTTTSPLLNRELSLLEFNFRVLEQARAPSTPLLERLRFLTISSSNLDEFFEIRVAGLKQQIAASVTKRGPDGLCPDEVLPRVTATAKRLVTAQYQVLNELLLPALDAEGIRILKRSTWNAVQRRWIRDYFEREVLPVLTPIGLDPVHPFPKIVNKSLNFLVLLRGKDAFGRPSERAVVQAPRVLPRLIALPKEVRQAPHEFVMLSSIIHAHVDALFPGMEVRSCNQFRVTRNSDLWVDEEESEDLLHALQGELFRRNYGDAVRLEVTTNSSPPVIEFLLEQFELGAEDLYIADGPRSEE